MEIPVDEDILAREAAMLEDIQGRLQGFEKERKSLIPMLQMIQERHAYLLPDALQMVADTLELAVCEVYGVATFYNQFRFHPPGKHHMKVCLGTACHVRGGEIILENFERKLGIGHGETTPDREFRTVRRSTRGLPCAGPGPDV